MINGIGIDVVDIDRMRESLGSYEDAFIGKVFTDEESEYCRSKTDPVKHFAARFAAKEAFSKALKTGWSGVFHWKDVEVVNEPSGAPIIRLHGKTEKLLKSCRIHCSLSHTDRTVAAVVVIEKEK